MKQNNLYEIECETLELLKQKIRKSQTISYDSRIGDTFKLDDFVISFSSTFGCDKTLHVYYEEFQQTLGERSIFKEDRYKAGVKPYCIQQKIRKRVDILCMKGFVASGLDKDTSEWKAKWDKAYDELLGVALKRLDLEKQRKRNAAAYAEEIKRQKRNAINTLIEVKHLGSKICSTRTKMETKDFFDQLFQFLTKENDFDVSYSGDIMILKSGNIVVQCDTNNYILIVANKERIKSPFGAFDFNYNSGDQQVFDAFVEKVSMNCAHKNGGLVGQNFIRCVGERMDAIPVPTWLHDPSAGKGLGYCLEKMIKIAQGIKVGVVAEKGKRTR